MADMKNYLKNLSTDVFSKLNPNEEMSFFVHSEESQFIRFNQSAVRQNTSVHQHELGGVYQKDQRTIRFGFNLSLDSETDFKNALAELKMCREQLPQIDIHPQFVAMTNHGVSESIKKVERPSDIEVLKIMTEAFNGTDMAGLYCAGPVRQISINSKGQFHFFESDYFFIDYSLYNGPKAAKGFFAVDRWDANALKKNIEATKSKLELLNRPVVNVPKGQYRVYLEPMAVQEILWTLNWGGLSCGALHRGRSLLKRLHQKEVSLSSHFSLSENLGLGYVPTFNSLGEIAPKELSLIEKGHSVNLLVSSSSAKEYNTPTNYASPQEAFRSPEIKPGALHEDDILKKLDTGLYLSNLHYINPSDLQSARLTGMTRYACFWVENGSIKGPIQDLRFDDSIYNLFGAHLLSLTQHQELFVDSSTYIRRALGAAKVPGALIENFNFTL